MTKLYNPHDGFVGRDGGPYLDQEERLAAEIRRAQVEGRKPDLENPPATAGTPLVTAVALAEKGAVNSNPSQRNYASRQAVAERIDADPEVKHVTDTEAKSAPKPAAKKSAAKKATTKKAAAKTAAPAK